MDFDLAILGGGPAGLACALRAADLGLTALLCEARPAASGRGGASDKPCGEGIMPEGARVLTLLGVTPIERRPFAGVRYLVAGAAPLEVDFAEPGAACWRGDLDQALSAAARLRPAIRLERGRADAERCADGGHRIRIGDSASGSSPYLSHSFTFSGLYQSVTCTTGAAPRLRIS